MNAPSFEERKALGTGDQNAGPCSSPAKLKIGARYATVSGDVVIVHEINGDGDVQVTFPSHPDENPNELYTVAKELILDDSEEEPLSNLRKSAGDDRGALEKVPTSSCAMPDSDSDDDSDNEPLVNLQHQ